MANVLLTPTDMVRDAAIILSDNLVVGNLCSRELEQNFADGVGDTVKVKTVPDLGDADEFSGTTVATDIVEASQDVVLEKHFYKRADLSSKQKTLELDDFVVQVLAPLVLTLAHSIEKYFIAKFCGGFARNLVGTAGVSPTTVAHILAARKKIQDNRAPYRNIAAIIDTTAETALLQVAQFINADYGNDRPQALKEGQLGRLHGANFFTSQPAGNSFNRGDVAGTVTVNGAAQSGSTLAVTGFTAATGTVKAGTRLTAAGVTGTYTVIADASIVSNGATLVLDRTLASAPANAAAVTFATAFTQNLLYNVRAAQGAIIAPAPLAGNKSAMETFNGLSVRVSMDGSTLTLSDSIVVDVFAGAKVIHSAGGTVLQG